VLSPAGIGAVLMLFVVGFSLARGVDARFFMAAGLFTMVVGNFWMSRLNLDIGPWQVVWPRVVIIAGLSMIFAPLNVAAFLYIPREMRGAAVGLLALLRNEGGSVGTSIAQTVLERRQQFHTLRLNENLDSLNPAVNYLFTQGRSFFLQHTGDAALSVKLTVQSLQNARDQQALSLAYFDVFWFSAAIAGVMVFLVLLMRRSVAEKGAHVAAE
jgi:DHA2 family multidrug resistance protein